jgi:6-pyruvoyltetrahydropterin/6-carboxytetrahydropterin synthase
MLVKKLLNNQKIGLFFLTNLGGDKYYFTVDSDFQPTQNILQVIKLTYKRQEMAKYISTKTYKQIGPVAYRQWRADSHCNLIHGYALSFHFEFECDTLDARNWCMDFGGLKPLKEKLEEWFDHTLLVAVDDPQRAELMKLGELKLAKITVVEKTGCEGLADFLYEYINTIFLPMYGKTEAERIWCCKVEVRETDSNMAMRVGHREDREFVD